MPNSASKSDLDAAKELLNSANSASQTVAALHIAFMAFAAYFGVIIWGTTHEDLLRISPIKLPILDVEVPLTTFYGGVPWLLVLLHFNLLIQLELLSRKLWNLDSKLPDNSQGRQLRDQLFIFPFSHFIAGRSNVLLVKLLLALVVGITVIVLPLCTLLAAQIRFLPFHDEAITWSQRIAVWVDVLMLLTLWPLIASAKDKVGEWWLNLMYRLFLHPVFLEQYGAIPTWNCLTRRISKRFTRLLRYQFNSELQVQTDREAKGMFAILLSVPLVLLMSIVAVIPGSITVKDWQENKGLVHIESPGNEKEQPHYFEDLLVRHAPDAWLSFFGRDEDLNLHKDKTCKPIKNRDKTANQNQLVVLSLTCQWFGTGWFKRNLNLSEARLLPKDVSIVLINRAISDDKATRVAAFKEFDGLNLHQRDMRFADLWSAVLLKADLRQAKLQGADVEYANLQDANMVYANLQGADLRWAKLQGADMGWANIQGADMGGANIQGAYMERANLQGADMRGAELYGAEMREAKLQGADMEAANLQSVEMSLADLAGVDWQAADLSGVALYELNDRTWQDADRHLLLAELKPVLSTELFKAFAERINQTNTKPPRGEPSKQQDCFSDNPSILNCPYQKPDQLPEYRTKVLFPQLVKLACSDPWVAEGIARRANFATFDEEIDFGLAAALLKQIDSPKPCAGLAGLSEATKQELRQTAEEQKNQPSHKRAS